MFFHVNQNGGSICQVETGMALGRNKGRQGRTRSFFPPLCLTTSTCVSISFARGPFMSSQQSRVLQQEDKIRDGGGRERHGCSNPPPCIHLLRCFLPLPFKLPFRMCLRGWLEINLPQDCPTNSPPSLGFFNVETVLPGPAAGPHPPPVSRVSPVPAAEALLAPSH